MRSTVDCDNVHRSDIYSVVPIFRAQGAPIDQFINPLASAILVFIIHFRFWRF